MRDSEEILTQITDEYKEKSYTELRDICGKVLCFRRNHKKKRFLFEIHAISNNGSEVKVMVECSRDIFPFRFFSKQRYFIINENNLARDAGGDEYWT